MNKEEINKFAEEANKNLIKLSNANIDFGNGESQTATEIYKYEKETYYKGIAEKQKRDETYIKQLENKVKDLERENKTLIHTNKSLKGMLDKQNRENKELIKYITEYKNEVVKKRQERINLHLTESVELNALEKFCKEILNQIKKEKE